MSSLVDSKKSLDAPIDAGNLAWIIMFFLGVGNLFPWNAFITASGYYANRFCGTSFEDNFESYFSFMFTFSQTVGLGLSVIFQDKLTFEQKIAYPLILYSLIFLLTTCLVGVLDIDPYVLFYVTCLCACLCGLCGAILSSGLYGLGAMLPPSYTAALMSGSGLAGFIVSVSGLLTTAAADSLVTCSDDNTEETCKQEMNYSALAYFLIATLVLIANVLSYSVLKRLPFITFFISRAAGPEEIAADAMSNPLLSGKEAETFVSGLDEHDHERHNRRSASIDDIERAHRQHSVDHRSAFQKIMAVYRKIWIPSVSVTLCFTVTIAIFPSLIVLVESVGYCHEGASRFSNDLFVPFLFVIFNLFDWFGRASGEWYTLYLGNSNIWIATLARVIFFPLFLLSDVSNSKLPVVFDSDAFPIIFMVFMAASNGFLATRCMIMGATAVEPKESSLAGTIMIFSLTVGLLFGACTSFLTVFISQGTA